MKAQKLHMTDYCLPTYSILLLNSSNQVLLLHRVQTSSSFASAHVFPGGNVDAHQDGLISSTSVVDRHEDGPAYRLAAVRECFEETGILLARDSVSKNLVEIPDETREAVRKEIHSNTTRFSDWLNTINAVPDVGKLLPFKGNQ
jgi:8-oxo-dGTP pyrophosphatase MutT (NUDIX family)